MLCGRFLCVLENCCWNPCKKENRFLFVAQSHWKLYPFFFRPFNYFWLFHCFVNVLPLYNNVFSAKHSAQTTLLMYYRYRYVKQYLKSLKVLLQIYFAQLASYFLMHILEEGKESCILYMKLSITTFMFTVCYWVVIFFWS